MASSTYRTGEEALSICHSKRSLSVQGHALWHENAPATFQWLINQLTGDLDGCEGCIDDIVIYSKTWQQHLECIRSLFNRLTQANLTVNLTKSEFQHAVDANDICAGAVLQPGY